MGVHNYAETGLLNGASPVVSRISCENGDRSRLSLAYRLLVHGDRRMAASAACAVSSALERGRETLLSYISNPCAKIVRYNPVTLMGLAGSEKWGVTLGKAVLVTKKALICSLEGSASLIWPDPAPLTFKTTLISSTCLVEVS